MTIHHGDRAGIVRNLLNATLQPFASRADAAAAMVPAEVSRIRLLGVGEYERAASVLGAALVSNAGTVGWRPADGRATPQHYGAKADGVADDTAALVAVLSRGGAVFIPDGTYRIAGAGPDAGGVQAQITTGLRVDCGPNARFVADHLDNDMIRLIVPADGAGLPADGIALRWCGGTFDQRAQKVSSVVPFAALYPAPAGLTGTSATCEALSIRGEYQAFGAYRHGIRSAVVDGVTCIAGSHWQGAGGDSGVFISGCETMTVQNGLFVGNRDLGVYASGAADSTLPGKVCIQNNKFVNCFHAVAAKRAMKDVVIQGNEAKNCVRGFMVETLGAGVCRRVVLTGNTGQNLNTPIRVINADGFAITGNLFETLGATLADGVTVEPATGCYGIALTGGRKGVVSGNSFAGLAPGALAAYPTSCHMFDLTTDVDTGRSCDDTVFTGNIGDGLRSGGGGAGLRNVFAGNVVRNATVAAHVTNLGAGGFARRTHPTTGADEYEQPVGFADGAANAPALYRRLQTSTGVRFGAGLVGVCVGGQDRLVVTATGLGVNGMAPMARPAITGSRQGNAALADLLTKLAAYGFITDSTTA